MAPMIHKAIGLIEHMHMIVRLVYRCDEEKNIADQKAKPVSKFASVSLVRLTRLQEPSSVNDDLGTSDICVLRRVSTML
jgi:hypothetical protein